MGTSRFPSSPAALYVRLCGTWKNLGLAGEQRSRSQVVCSACQVGFSCCVGKGCVVQGAVLASVRGACPWPALVVVNWLSHGWGLAERRAPAVSELVSDQQAVTAGVAHRYEMPWNVSP